MIGSFTQDESLNRLRYAERHALRRIWRLHDWDFKASTSTINTTSGNLGPYDPPSGLVRFCTTQKVSSFGHEDSYRLLPINQMSGDEERLTPYLKVSDGKIYFVNNPGTGTLTLNYVGRLSNAIDETTLTASFALFPDDFIDPALEFVLADLKKYLPGMTQEVSMHDAAAKMLISEIWEDYTKDKYQKTIAPKGLNQMPIDFVARQIVLLGNYYVVQSEDA